MYKRLTETDFKGEWTLKDRQGEELPLYYMNYRDVQAVKTAIRRLAEYENTGPGTRRGAADYRGQSRSPGKHRTGQRTCDGSMERPADNQGDVVRWYDGTRVSEDEGI